MAVSLVKSFLEPPIDSQEILRYAGQKGKTSELDGIITECLEEAKPYLTYKVCYAYLPCEVSGVEVMLGDKKLSSISLSKNLSGCEQAVIFSSTIGIGIDRLIEKYKAIAPLKSLIMHAIGVERIESLANSFCAYLKEELALDGKKIRPRFSAGYGDFKVENQRLFFEYLESTKLLGLTLNDSYLMSPSKSVTAIVGIYDCEGKEQAQGCKDCVLKDCEYRR